MTYQGWVDQVTGIRSFDVSRARHPFWYWLLMCLWVYTGLASLHGLIFG